MIGDNECIESCVVFGFRKRFNSLGLVVVLAQGKRNVDLSHLAFGLDRKVLANADDYVKVNPLIVDNAHHLFVVGGNFSGAFGEACVRLQQDGNQVSLFLFTTFGLLSGWSSILAFSCRLSFMAGLDVLVGGWLFICVN